MRPTVDHILNFQYLREDRVYTCFYSWVKSKTLKPHIGYFKIFDTLQVGLEDFVFW